MLHSPSGFPSRISCRIIGCDFSSPDTFTYRLLKAVSCKYHVANLYCAGDFWAHTVTDDGVHVVFIQGFELALRLQHQAGRDLTASDGRHKTLQIRDLPDVCRLVDQAAHMDGKPAPIHIIRPLAQAVKQNDIVNIG